MKKVKINPKQFILISLFFFNIAVNSQSLYVSGLDQDYLNSLPEDVMQDILKESKKSQDEKKDTLKSRPSTELMKLDVVKDWEDFQKSRQASRNKSERYGVNLFRTMQSSFMPINEPNFGNNYILDYGDFLEIQVIAGNNSNKYSSDIKRDGSFNLEEIGPLNLAGLNFDQAVNLINNKYKNSIIGVDVIVNLEKIRDIKILITGSVEYPGMYTLSGNSNVLQALNISGGILENGSLREILIKRNGKTIEEIDLYDALIFGDTSSLSNLQSGDAIYISPSKNLVRAGTGFNNQAIFELLDTETLSDLIKYAGGVNKNAYSENYSLLRNEGQDVKIINLNSKDINSFKIKHHDSLYLPEQQFGFVEITGEVLRPGKYTISGDDDIYDLIVRAGGYTSSAYPFGGVMTSKKAMKLEKQMMSKAYQSLISYIVESPASLTQSSGLPMLLDEIKNSTPSGRVITEFDLIKLEDDPRKRILLTNKDKIHIPKNENNVYVYGAVSNPGAIVFDDNFEVKNYINLSGGLIKVSDASQIVVISPNGSASIVKLGKVSSLFNSNQDIYPGSLIYVPTETKRNLEFFATTAPIFSSLALSIASLSALNNNNNNNNNN